MDFYQIAEESPKKNEMSIFPDFLMVKSEDLMVRGNYFYAIWDEELGLWNTDEYAVKRIIDKDLFNYKQKKGNLDETIVKVKYLKNTSNGKWYEFKKKYVPSLPENYHQLDMKITFSNSVVEKKDYISRRLPYPLIDGDYSAWDEIVGTLYEPEEREKIEWAIGSIFAGDSVKIQKFLVFYGQAGAGKSTILKIVEKLFEGYYAVFDAKSLTEKNNQFSLSAFGINPLVAIQHDGDLSRIEDNTKLNSIVSHEKMLVNEKFRSPYPMRPSCFLFMATNKPVKITDAKSGIIRRLIDVQPNKAGRKIEPNRYDELMEQVEFQLGAIAQHCKEVYLSLGKSYYDSYRPMEMMYKTDEFFNFVDDAYFEFKKNDGVTLKRAYDMYGEYCERSGALHKMQMYLFKEELKNYFRNFDLVARIDGQQVRKWYSGFDTSKFTVSQPEEEKPKRRRSGDIPSWLNLKDQHSILDDMLADCPAQYATEDDKPMYKWTGLKSVLGDIHTDRTHYVKPPLVHIVVDLDMKNDAGEKDIQLNLKEASKWPKTYAEVSKGGHGLHLHYIYDGDPTKLAPLYKPNVEVKVFNGKSSLRRRVSLCNDIPVAHLSSGLPLKEEKEVINFQSVQSEKKLRSLVEENLRKEHHPGTKPSIDFIDKILEDAYNSDLHYDLSDMVYAVTDFAAHSSHQAPYCVAKVAGMKFRSKDISEAVMDYDSERFVFFDIEVFPNVIFVNWKFMGDNACQHMINPSPEDIERLMKYRLIGFNCRRYDNHILYAIYIGKTIEEVYNISYGIVNGYSDCSFGEAYNISYTDVYDFCSTKQSLKKWEIELGIHHQELGMKWDEPVPEEKWSIVSEYCDNDVVATEAVFNARQADWTARQILADIADMTVNDTTNSLTTRIIFDRNRKPQNKFNYYFMGNNEAASGTFDTDLDIDRDFNRITENGNPIFPDYTYSYSTQYKKYISLYRGEEVGEGGYVYAEPGIHRNVALLDIASMHPSSIVALNLFGDVYTKRFQDILNTRIYIKHKEYDKAKELFDGKLAKYLEDESQAKALAQALKIAINSVYGLTSAKFENSFRDPRNRDNIVAKRGALFMVNLKHEVQKRGFTVAHIKTDSIKIPDATPDIIRFVTDYGKLFGYNFEHEATYDRMCLVNDAVYIAKYSEDKRNEHPGEWTATGTQFQVPYVFKTLFSKEPIRFGDLCETKSVTGSLYLDMNERLPDVENEEKEVKKLTSKLNKMQEDDPGVMDIRNRIDALNEIIAKGHYYVFVGRVGLFCPVKPGYSGGMLMREKDGKYYAVGGSSGYRWIEAESRTNHFEEIVDMRYFNELADDAIQTISKYGDFYDFVSGSPCSDAGLPWHHEPMCGEHSYESCLDCPHWKISLDRETADELYYCDNIIEGE